MGHREREKKIYGPPEIKTKRNRETGKKRKTNQVELFRV